MYIKANLLRITAPMIIAKAIDMFPIMLCIEAVVAGGCRGLVDEEGLRGVLYLPRHASQP